MAIWNAPIEQEDYVMNACKAAVDMVEGSKALSQELLEKFGRTVSFGIGVHCGSAVVGNIGAEMRMDFTAIGDTVNTSARLEANAPAGKIYISRDVVERLGGRIRTTSLGDGISLKGKSQKLEIFLLDWHSRRGVRHRGEDSMKKLLSILLAASLVLALSAPVLASYETEPGTAAASGLGRRGRGAVCGRQLQPAPCGASRREKQSWPRGGPDVKDLSGRPVGGYKDGNALEAVFEEPWGLAPYRDGLLITDRQATVPGTLSGPGRGPGLHGDKRTGYADGHNPVERTAAPISRTPAAGNSTGWTPTGK